MEKTIICLRSADNHSVVKIEKGELISYQKKRHRIYTSKRK